jgi:DNA gyrase subunit B/topoisomerase-4 subunit B
VTSPGCATARSSSSPRPWETTLSPNSRRVLRVEIADQLVTDRVINELMGKDASARFRFIMERAEDAQELDV